MADPTTRTAGAVRAERPLVEPDDLRAAIGARRELGPEHEDELVERFVERIERGVEARARQRAVERRLVGPGNGEVLALAIVSLALGVPLTAIVAASLATGADLVGLLVVWTAIAVVNVVHARAPVARR
jgi:hypothetical protein